MSAERPFLKKSYSDLVADLIADLGRPVPGRTALTDAAEGSVMRTLVEAFSRELAVAYEQLETVYRFGYLDTAEGAALDQVVALLGVHRRRAGATEGLVAFQRSAPAPEDIPIPAGTLVAGRDIPSFETTEDGILAQGYHEVEVAARALDDTQEPVEPGAISVMPRPILGIETVTNLAALAPRQAGETDEELRARALRARDRFHSGAVAVIEQAVAELGLAEVRVQEHLPERPGDIEVVIGDPDVAQLLPTVRLVLEDVRPAGVRVAVRAARQVYVQPALILVMDPVPPDSEARALQGELAGALARYIGSLGPNQNVRWSKARALLAAHDAVLDVLAIPGVPTLGPFFRDPAGESEGDTFTSVASTHLNGAGDVIIGASERARLDVRALAPILRIEPPELDVWIDVEAHTAGPAAPSEADLRDQLAEIVAAEVPGTPARYAAWVERLGSLGLAGISFSCDSTTATAGPSR